MAYSYAGIHLMALVAVTGLAVLVWKRVFTGRW